MGMGRFTPADWDAFTAAQTAGRSRSAVFSHGLQPGLDPKLVKGVKGGVRESRDSALNPAPTPMNITCGSGTGRRA